MVPYVALCFPFAAISSYSFLIVGLRNQLCQCAHISAAVSTRKGVLELLSVTNMGGIQNRLHAPLPRSAVSMIPDVRGLHCAFLKRYVVVAEAGLLQSLSQIWSTTTTASSSWRTAILETPRAYLRPQLNNLFVQRIVVPDPWFACSNVLYTFPWLAYRYNSGCARSSLMDPVRQLCHGFRLGIRRSS